jgi:hypothetical protein
MNLIRTNSKTGDRFLINLSTLIKSIPNKSEHPYQYIHFLNYGKKKGIILDIIKRPEIYKF